MKITKATDEALPVVVALACRLWPDSEAESLYSELAGIITQPEAAFFLAWEDGEAVGFAQCQLRRDYVEGTDSSPVGYLEGIYVAPAYRQQHIASALLQTCQQWAKAQGCAEFASDCELTNEESFRFHLKAGFQEANRIICFVKKI